MKKRLLPLFLLVTAFIVIAAGCGGNNKNNTNAPAPANNTGTNGNAGNTTNAANAEATYKAQCVGCHAADLSGGVGPNLQKIGGSLTAEQISTQIHNGGGGMPAYKGTLSEDEITALTNWLASKK
ncbi:c-type cytochrome [Paenibacillus solisilvae]|uniref:C-type cytochrome n=1 Tax=Paenibacillus solisilvae TaxID=2486751 RepID=A0ABW0W025_9BACL